MRGLCRLTEILAFGLVTVLLACSGCHHRAWYFRRANEDAHGLINEKSGGTPWAVPAGYSLVPSPDSRLAPVDCLASPRLPCPTPSLYAYQLPALRSRAQQVLGADQSQEELSTDQQDDDAPKGVPIPADAWETLPAQCLRRMLEFDSIRREADYTKENFDDFELSSQVESNEPELTLEDIVDLALLNSREYQTQKETLFLVSLNLSEERFAYVNKFSNFGNGTVPDYTHNRSGGITQNRLAIPSGVRGDKLLITGGDLFASFANNVLLTFNGPDGFAADVSSTLLVDYAQPLLQRDIRFESLTQAERNLVYAARDFARFRKQFFTDFSELYYRIILSFRQVEIEAQNYFSLVRAFNQAEAEYRSEFVPRVQVDQVEQSLLGGRGSLIGTCNSVEQSLDSLKIAMGIPTETPLNVNLTELNELTRLDQLSVSSDSTTRVLRRLRNESQRPDRVVLASTGAVLIERLLEAAQLTTEEVGEEIAELRSWRARLLVDEARLASQQELAALQLEVESETPSAEIIFQRANVHARYLTKLITRQLEYAELLHSPDQLIAFAEQQLQLAAEVNELGPKFQDLFGSENKELRLAELPALVVETNSIRERLMKLVDEIDEFNSMRVINDPDEDLRRIVEDVTRLAETVENTVGASQFGLKPIEINPDDAMVTALALRFELMTQRESAADDWRRIKLAADELKSVLDVNARQVIRTESGANQPFNFTLDDSTTQLGLTFDAPLNRFTERNDFRASLIGYQRALRNLMQLEDTIKFSVRNDLRNLALDREQYLIAVASAALAYERVVSTSLEFRLGTGGVSARDFLEAQTAYTNSLSAVASRHISYILDRTQLFLDLELLIVDETGFWPELRNEEVQPESFFGLPSWAFPVYGELPPVLYSHEMRNLMNVQPLCAGSLTGNNSSTEAHDTEPLQDQDETSNDGVPIEEIDKPLPLESDAHELSDHQTSRSNNPDAASMELSNSKTQDTSSSPQLFPTLQ